MTLSAPSRTLVSILALLAPIGCGGGGGGGGSGSAAPSTIGTSAAGPDAATALAAVSVGALVAEVSSAARGAPTPLAPGAEGPAASTEVGSSDFVGSASGSIAPATGAISVLVVLARFQDSPASSWTPDVAQQAVFGDASALIRESSYGQAWLAGDVAGWFTLPGSSTSVDADHLADLAAGAASSAGFHPGAYTHLLVAFPPTTAFAWQGLGDLAGSRAWLNGSLAPQLIAHEIGHNLGLAHSHGRVAWDGALGRSGVTIDQGDPFDFMAFSTGHPNAFQKERLGWLAGGSIVAVGASGSYHLNAYESQTSGTKALKIPRSTDPTTGSSEFYYVEARRALGADSFVAGQGTATGVVVHLATEGDGASCVLLDATPDGGPLDRAAVVVGTQWSDAEAGISIAVTAADDSGADVLVTLGPATPPVASGHATAALGVGTAAAGAAVSGSLDLTFSLGAQTSAHVDLGAVSIGSSTGSASLDLSGTFGGAGGSGRATGTITLDGRTQTVDLGWTADPITGLVAIDGHSLAISIGP